MNKNELKKHVEHAVIGDIINIEDLYNALVAYHAGLTDIHAGVFMLAGPTGVGKNLLVETVAEFLHGSPKTMVKIEGGSYIMEHASMLLIGAPPSYEGFGKVKPALHQSHFTEATSNASKLSILLVDESDKIHPNGMKVLLNLMDKGTASLMDGSKVSVKDTILFFTSNFSQAKIHNTSKYGGFGIGFTKPSTVSIVDEVRSEVGGYFSPEFVNRIDHFLIFPPLTKENCAIILSRELEKLQKFITKACYPACINLTVKPEVLEYLLDRGFSDKYGARELRKTLFRAIKIPIADHILSHGKVSFNAKFVLDGEPIMRVTHSKGTVIPVIPVPQKNANSTTA